MIEQTPNVASKVDELEVPESRDVIPRKRLVNKPKILEIETPSLDVVSSTSEQFDSKNINALEDISNNCDL